MADKAQHRCHRCSILFDCKWQPLDKGDGYCRCAIWTKLGPPVLEGQQRTAEIFTFCGEKCATRWNLLEADQKYPTYVPKSGHKSKKRKYD